MNWLLAIVAATGVLAGPVVASVVAPSLVTQVAEQGLAVQHRRFVFNEQFDVAAEGQDYLVQVYDADLYELPLTTQVVLRGAVIPAPGDQDLQEAIRFAARKYHLPLLSYDLQRDGDDITVRASMPAGILANISPQYRELVDRYEV